ncbi:MAG: hypothetical protein ABSE40_18910 [Candidatus Sulfotelmatobacter sp.]|jgi:hypothetical protein
MAGSKGLWIAVGGGPHADKISASIHYNGQFTTTVPKSEVRPRVAELVIVSMQGTDADYLGISQAGRLVAVDQTTTVISSLVELSSMTSERIKEKLPSRLARRFEPPTKGVYRVSPRLWSEVLKVVSSTPGTHKRVQELRQAVAEPARPQRRTEGGLEVFERDAIASALQVWGGPSFRKRILREAAVSGVEPTAPFLKRLEKVSVREDPQISHDQITFPGMEVAQASAVGSVLLLRGDGDYLTILNCNRQPLEQTLGVDLIYYNHRFDSFVLVQYKRMTEGEHGPEYRPQNNRNHQRELNRMIMTDRMLEARAKPRDRRTATYRLSRRPFFLKLCESKAKVALDAGMVSGMYIPLELWRRLLKSPAVRGPRGGITVTCVNSRKLTNGQFTNLLRNGWIGSAAGESKELSRIIESVLAAGRMLVLAATIKGPRSDDFRRDDWGRFAAEDDPSAAI